MIPQRWHPYLQLIQARVREFYREPEVLFWVYGFPLILALGLFIAFSGREPERPEVDVEKGPGATALAETLQTDGFKVEIHDADQCKKRFVRGKTGLFIHLEQGKPKYIYDPMRSESVLALYWVQAALAHANGTSESRPAVEAITAPGSRYIDFLLPGLVGMNLMGGGLFGVGFVLVDMRVRKLFKRLIATPMRHSDFLLAILTSRLLFLIPEMLVLLVVARLGFGVPINGSIALLALVVLLGATAFAGIGLLLGCRTDKTETMSGYINLLMLPQYILSGVFFSSSRFPDAIQPIIQALPLTQLNSALREVMLQGSGITVIWWRLAILAAYAIVCFALALRWFRWR